jgi:hypothetical protein
VGTLEAIAVADRRDVDLGDSIKLKVEWSGDGNLEFFDLPDLGRLPAFEGFRSYGATDELRQRFARVATFDLAPLDPGLTEIPAVPLWVFDPEQDRYRLVETRPIPIRVRALAGSGGLEDEAGAVRAEDIRDLWTAPLAAATGGPEPGRGRSGVPLGLGLGATGGLLLAWGLLRRPLRRGSDPAAPLERRRRRALRQLGRDLGRAASPDQRYLALCAYLAARTREQAEAWVGRDPLAWWREGAYGRADAEPPAELGELVADLGALERAAFGPDVEAGSPDDGRLLGLARRLQGGVL